MQTLQLLSQHTLQVYAQPQSPTWLSSVRPPTWESSVSSSICRSTPAFSSMSSILLISWMTSSRPLGLLDTRSTHTAPGWERPWAGSLGVDVSPMVTPFRRLLAASGASLVSSVVTHNEGKTRSFCSSSCSCTVNALRRAAATLRNETAWPGVLLLLTVEVRLTTSSSGRPWLLTMGGGPLLLSAGTFSSTTGETQYE
ncbi:hypothetical protein EYF80_057634 [Liparis tanakae]|uniref:Uncharacterized protein n=1 Tax=Liparis tanakae TaxID=230148 RepID=A0A4Z2ETT3_9TELE|nr:hypothetical protein EYF80_057634 [Liparis tanakae]